MVAIERSRIDIKVLRRIPPKNKKQLVAVEGVFDASSSGAGYHPC